MSGQGRRGRRIGRVMIVALAILAIGTAAGAAGGFGWVPIGHGRDGNAAAAGGGLPPASAKVTRQTLVDTQTESGDLGFGEVATFTGRLAGTVTWLPAAGTTLSRGQAVYRVDNLPVVLLYGALPAYRPLGPGTDGADVKQFEQNLYALGYRGFTVDDSYSAATASTVKRWQHDLGLPQTGTVDLGRVVYGAGPVRVDTRKAGLGSPAGPGAPVLDYTGTTRVVTVELAMTDQRLAQTGVAVSVKLPDGRRVPGKIAGTRTVVKPAEGQNPAQTKIDVDITLTDDNGVSGNGVSGLDQASVDVDFTASRRENVLTVPVAALLALAEGGYGVQVVEGTGTRIVAVQTGLFAGGRVEVSGGGLAEGMTVGVPS